MNISQERLREVLDYNPDTGVFKWRESFKARIKGATAGSDDGEGYIVIMINGKQYKAHRLAILYTDGYLPENTVDHIDRVRSNNPPRQSARSVKAMPEQELRYV